MELFGTHCFWHLVWKMWLHRSHYFNMVIKKRRLYLKTLRSCTQKWFIAANIQLLLYSSKTMGYKYCDVHVSKHLCSYYYICIPRDEVSLCTKSPQSTCKKYLTTHFIHQRWNVFNATQISVKTSYNWNLHTPTQTHTLHSRIN